MTFLGKRFGEQVSFLNMYGNLTVTEFEKEATAKTGMDASVYYEIKAEGKLESYPCLL